MHVASISDATLFRREISANCGIFTRVTGSSDVLIYRDTHTEIPRPQQAGKKLPSLLPSEYCDRKLVSTSSGVRFRDRSETW